MIKETSLCMGCMNDKTYDGPCKLCGYSDNTPNIPTYLAPKTFLADRYIVGKVISYNGEGAVYIGYDTAAGAKVTIKEFMPDTLCSRRKGETDITVDPSAAALYKTYLSEFIDLNRTLMKLRGMSHVQTVLDVFCENNTAYVVFEYINGISLKTYLANSSGVITWEQAKELFSPFFTTLSLIHSAGIIHRGISPSTIFVTDKLELKLTGFAICAARTTGTEIPCEMFAGFAAPEQYTNEINGTWTDVYGISAVLYRCLTGCIPTEAIARNGTSLMEPMMINRNIPANISSVIMAGLNISPEDRVRTITEFVDRLFTQPKAAEPAPAEKAKLTRREQKQRRERNKTIAVMVIAGIVFAAFIVVFVLTLNGTLTGGNSTPDFSGRSYDYETERYGSTFTFVPKYEYSDTYANGLMYDQSIEAGKEVTAGITVVVKVSKGPSRVALPDYTGQTPDKYIAELSKLNIKYSVTTERSNEAKDGYVFKCSVEIGDLVDVENGQEVTVYCAENYPPTVEATMDGTAEPWFTSEGIPVIGDETQEVEEN